MKRIITAVLCLSALFTACGEKDEETKPDTFSIEGKWAYSLNINKQTKGGSVLYVDTTKYTGSNFITFKSDNTYSYILDNGDTDNGTWKLSNNGKRLVIDAGTADADSAEIKTLTEKDLSLYFKVTDGDEIEETTAQFKR